MKPKAVEIAHKIELWASIKRLGRLWGEDELSTAEFGKTVYRAYMEDLEGVLKCFSELNDQAQWIAPNKKEQI